MNEFIASRDLSSEDFEKFSEQCRRGFNYHRSSLNEYRQKSEGYATLAQSSLRALNDDKAYAMKHGVDLEPKKLRFVFFVGMSEPHGRETVMIRTPDLETAKIRAREALERPAYAFSSPVAFFGAIATRNA